MNNENGKFGQTSSYLTDYCIINNIKLNGILMLPEFIEKNIPIGFWIINSDSINRGGMHWLAAIVWLNKEDNYLKSLFWFDSFGFRPHKMLLDKCKQNNIKCYYNPIQFQNLNEYTCGIFACGFLSFCQSQKQLTLKYINKALEEMKNYDIVFPK